MGFILFLILGSSALMSCQEMTLIGDAIEAFRPCHNAILTMERIIGGPPSKENYWDGIFHIENSYPNLTQANFHIQLSAPANISVNPEIGIIMTHANSFNISYSLTSDDFKRLKFHVKGKPLGIFPNIIKILLNNDNVCPNAAEWHPTILGINTNFGILENESLI